MGDRTNGWITVGPRYTALPAGPAWEAERETMERETITVWDNDEHWPSV